MNRMITTPASSIKRAKEQEMAKKNRKWQLGILLIAIALLSAAFLCLNFRIAASSTTSEKNMTTSSIGEGLPHTMQRREKINLAIVGEGPLVAALQHAMLAEMNNAGIGEMETVQEIVPRYQSPVLVVKVGKPDMFWTPFFATGRFTAKVGYSSVGDTTFMGEKPATIDNRDGPALQMYGEYKVSDRSWGLISLPGYHHILADYLAQQIVATLKDLYKVAT